MRGRILIVEDVPEMAELIKDNLEFEGFNATTAGSGEEGLAAITAGHFDLVIIDLNLPGIDGFEFLERLRRTKTMPVMIVSARGEESDVVTGLGIGADEYLQKPFSPKALVARVRALIRRARQYRASDMREVVKFGPFELDLESGVLLRDGERIPLSAREFSVLACLARAGEKPLRPEEIFDAAWERAYGDLAAVGVYIQRLRRKLEDDPSTPRHLLTERGFGYRLAGIGTPGSEPEPGGKV